MPSRALLGGPNILGTSGVSAANQFFLRSYSGISPHTYVSFTLVLWYFDDWSSRNYLPGVKFILDSKTVTGPSLLYSNDFTSSEGGNSAEKDSGFDHIMAGTFHTGATMVFEIIGLLTDTIDSRRFGFREISFTFSNYGGPLPAPCHRSEEVASLAYSQCSCPLGQALSGTSCVSCAPGCSKCFGPFASQCFQCDTGLLWTGAQCCDPKCSVCSGVTSDECSECNSPYFNYKNGTCKATCPSPFQSTTQGSQTLCNEPCQSGEYYYSFNQTCLSKCPSPLSPYTDPSDNILYCLNPCDPTTQYLFTNGTCLNSCPSLLASRQEPGVQYCFNPCPSPSTNSIFTTNGTCLTSCPSPLSIYEDPGLKYCFNPCPDPVNQYLFQNASCFNTCPSPLASRSEFGVQYCFDPCTSPDYLYPNGTCSSQCLSPLISRTEPDVTYCFNPCSSYDLYLYTNQSCFTTCPSPLAYRIEPAAQFCFNPCPDPSTDFLFPNQSCFSTCPFPLANRIEPDVQYCFNPCPPNQFLFPNQSCFETCPSPLISRTEPDVKYCFNPCTSPTAEYLYPNGTCSTQCISPLVSRSEPDVMYCFNPCSSITLFLYTNQSCLTTCPSPLAWRSEPVAKFCWNPCPDPTNDFLFPNQSCFSTCPYPLKSRTEPGVKYCYNPCSLSSFLFWNQTCSSTCLTPLVPKYEPGVNYCINPCLSPTTELLYQNGSCQTTCPWPLFQRSEPGVKYCYNPCQYPGSYLYTNGTCSNYCPTPLISRSEPDVDYCFPPCPPHLYWYINTTCLPACDFPYVRVFWSGVAECLAPCKNLSNYYYQYEKTCQKTCDPPFFQYYFVDQIKVCFSEFNTDYATVLKGRSSAASVDSQIKASSALAKVIGMLKSNHPSAALLAGYSSMFQYIRYIDIQYPPKVEILFAYSSPNPITLTFNFSAPSSLQNHTLPENFDKYQIHSDFLHNTWGLLGTLLVSSLVIITLEITLKIFKKPSQPKAYLLKILQTVKWNIPVMLLFSTSGDILFFASLHFNAMQFNGFLAFISLLMALVMITAVLGLLYLTIKPVLTLRKSSKNTGRSEYLKHFWKNYDLLYRSFEEKSLLKLSYMSVFLIRGLIFSLVISCFYNLPLIQVSMITLCNVLMIGYLLFSRPFKSNLNFLQAIVNELLLMVLSICILILALMDQQGTDNQTMRINLGEAIIFVIKAFNWAVIAFLGLYILLGIRFLWKKYKHLEAKGVSGSMLQAMIFEEYDPKKRTPQDLLQPEKRQRIFKPLRNNLRNSSQGHLPLRHFVAEHLQDISLNKTKSAADFNNMSSQSVIRLNNALELSRLVEEEPENIEIASLNNRPSIKSDETPSEIGNKIDDTELEKSSPYHKDKSGEELRLSLDSDQASKSSENLIQIFKKFRNKKAYKKSQINIHHHSLEKSDSEKSILQEKPKVFKEEESDILKLALPEDSETTVTPNQSVISDFRSFRNKQNRTRERMDKKNWYDGVRKGQLGKDEAQDDF